MGYIFIRLVSFPCIRTYGATKLDGDGNYNIYIDERLSKEKMLETFRHEMRHIEKNHFSETVLAFQAEKEV